MILKFGRTERKKPLLTALPPQYFLWYTILLPFYLPYSSLLSSPRLGLTAAALWIGTQVLLILPLPPTLLLPLPFTDNGTRLSGSNKHINSNSSAKARLYLASSLQG